MHNTANPAALRCNCTALSCNRNQDQHGVLARLPTCIPTQGIYPTCVLLCAIVCVCGATPTTRKSNYTGKPAANPIHLSWRLLTSAYLLHTYLPLKKTSPQLISHVFLTPPPPGLFTSPFFVYVSRYSAGSIAISLAAPPPKKRGHPSQTTNTSSFRSIMPPTHPDGRVSAPQLSPAQPNPTRTRTRPNPSFKFVLIQPPAQPSQQTRSTGTRRFGGCAPSQLKPTERVLNSHPTIIVGKTPAKPKHATPRTCTVQMKRRLF